MKPRSAPYWYDRFPQRRRPAFPRHRGTISTDVAIIGGGLTGCACAWAFTAARVPIVLIEADRLGAGATAGALGLIREDFDAPFIQVSAAHGVRAARTLFAGMRRAALDFPAALKRARIDCELTPRDLLTLAAGDRETARRLRRDYEARRKAGLDHSWLTAPRVARDTAIAAGGAIRTRGAVIDPYRACLGLASAAAARGAAVFERSEARRIKSLRNGVQIVTAGGVIDARTVVVCTGAPLPDLRALRRHLRRRDGYGVVTDPLPAAVRRTVGRRDAVIRDADVPPHFVRWLKDDRVLIEGADQAAVPAKGRGQALVQRTGQLMYELSLLYPAISGTQPAWSWTYGFDDTADGLPYIGPHRNFPRHLFALGLARHGLGAAWLAARLLLRHRMEEPAKGDDLFGFSRILQGHA